MNQDNDNYNEQTIIHKMHNLLETYYTTIIDNFKNNVPKLIMYFLVNKIEKELSTKFYENIITNDCTIILKEEPTIYEKRKILKDKKEKLVIANNLINEIEIKN